MSDRLLAHIIHEAAAAIANTWLKREGRDWREKLDRQGQGLQLTQVALVAHPLPHPHTMGESEVYGLDIWAGLARMLRASGKNERKLPER